jgi:5-methylcytosine-specific restriction endonuclease McrA
MKVSEMNNEGQNAVVQYAQFVEELERQKQKAKSELIKKLKDIESTITQEFIDWYYWDTDNDLEILSEVVGVSLNKLAKLTKTPHLIEYKCQRCKQIRLYPCNSRNEAADFLRKIKNKRCKEDYYCQQCKDELKREETEKLARKAQTKLDRARNKLQELKTMPYEEYLLTKHWKDFKKARIIEANFECQRCHRGDIKLHVHHLTYERRGEELPSDVVVLCEACHREEHGLKIPKYLIQNPISLRDRAMAAIHN